MYTCTVSVPVLSFVNSLATDGQAAMTLPAGYSDWRTLPLWRAVGQLRELFAMFLAHRRLRGF